MVRMLRNCLQLQHEATNAALALLLGKLTCSFGQLDVVLSSMHCILASEVALEAADAALEHTAPPNENAGCCNLVGNSAANGEDMDLDVDVDCSMKALHESGTQSTAAGIIVRSSETSCLLHLLTHEISTSPTVLLGSSGEPVQGVMECLVGLLRECLQVCVDEKEHLTAEDASSCKEELECRIGKGRRCCAALVLEACLRVWKLLHLAAKL
jgi:hypothetical protein